MPPRRRSPPSAAQQGGLFCRSCGAPLAGDDELRQGECNACYDLFADPLHPTAPAPPPKAESKKRKAERWCIFRFPLSIFSFPWRVRQAIRDLGISAALTYLAYGRPGSAPARLPPRMRTRSLFD